MKTRWWRRLVRSAVGVLSSAWQWAGSQFARLPPAQLVILGFASYVAFGVAMLSLPICTRQPLALVDQVFTATSAVSTTGLSTVSTSGAYTIAGQVVVLLLIQLGGVGYMTLSSFVILARGRTLTDTRRNILGMEFALPREIELSAFVRRVVRFTVLIEAAGTLVLWLEFRAAGVPDPLWCALFHSVSAFATAGFSLFDDSLERFRDNGTVCLTIGVLSYLGSLGFIVLLDAWRSVRYREAHLTFTSKVILGMTAVILVGGTLLLTIVDPTISAMPPLQAWQVAAFQVMTASTTAGFNTVPIAGLSVAALMLTTIVMIIGASPSGTGGGIKTTSLSTLLAVLAATVRGRRQVLFFGHEIPESRVLTAVGASTLYLLCLATGLFMLCLAESQSFLALAFEAASALGTVGLSMGVTPNLGEPGKWLVITLMFMGRVGPLTLGVAFLRRRVAQVRARDADLAV